MLIVTVLGLGLPFVRLLVSLLPLAGLLALNPIDLCVRVIN